MKKLNQEKIDHFILLRKQGLTLKEISNKTGCSEITIRKYLDQNGISVRNLKCYKHRPSNQEKIEIINLYLKKRGIQYISDKLNIDWYFVKDVLLKNNIPFWSRSELAKSNRDYYGITKGFSGHRHKKSSKKQISKSLIGNANRTVTGSKSQFILTRIGKVQGSFEVAYLQGIIKKGLDLPKIGCTVQTPYGLYFPDFEYDDRFIEVKSKFTWDVCNGIEPNPKGIKTNRQRKKIDWTSKYIKPVEIVILENKEALDLFREAIENNDLVTEKVIYKNGKYYKSEVLPVL